MAALLPKLAITVVLAQAWWRAGAPIEAGTLRRRLMVCFGLALALRAALELEMRAGAGAAGQASAFLAALIGLALLWPLLRLALAGPLTRGGRITRGVSTVIGLVLLWLGGPGDATLWCWIAFTRCAWVGELKTGERFRAAAIALAAGLVLFVGVHSVNGLPSAAQAAESVAGLARSVAIVYALYAASAAFKAFTQDPTLGVRRVSRRLVLSHVLVFSVPLAIVLALWLSSTYLGVNADRALMTVRALDREGARLEETLDIALTTQDARAGAAAVASGRLAHWPSLRVYVVADSVARVTGGPLPEEAALGGWVARLDSLRHHGIVELSRKAYLGAAASRTGVSLVALEPVTEAFDSTLSPLMGADVRMVSLDRGAPDTVRVAGGGSVRVVPMRPGKPTASLNVGRDKVTTFAFTGYALVPGVSRNGATWQADDFTLSARATLHATVAGLFVHLRENPLQIVPVTALAFLAFMLLPLANTDLKMVRGMGGSITRAIGALREGAEAFGQGKLAHRIPIAGDDDLWDTAQQFNRMAAGLEHARELEKQRDRLEHELDLARRIQARLLPSAPPQVPGLDVAGLSESAREVGGDYYDHLDLGNGRLLLVIADVSGKGVPAALLMSGFRASLVSQDLTQAKPEAIAMRVNEFLNRSVEPGRFVTAFLGTLDAATGKLAYVNAGHNPPLLLRAGGAVESLEVGGVILGILPGSRYASGEVTLAPGDLVALYTDGVTEGANAANEMWGEERLAALVRTSAASTAREIATRIVREVRAFEGERGPADDITVLVAKRERPPLA